MNKTAIIATSILGIAILGAVTAVTYKSIQVSTEAKNKVIEYSKIYKLSQKDTASQIILAFSTTTPFVNYRAGYEDAARSVVAGVGQCLTSTSTSDVISFLNASSTYGFLCKDLQRVLQK